MNLSYYCKKQTQITAMFSAAVAGYLFLWSVNLDYVNTNAIALVKLFLATTPLNADLIWKCCMKYK